MKVSNTGSAPAGLLDGLRDACRGGRPVPEAVLTRVDAERERLAKMTAAVLRAGSRAKAD